MKDELAQYFDGQKLYGDDFTIVEIEAWYKDEAEGYADLGAGNKSDYQYVYHELNTRNAFRYLRNRQFREALGFGSAYGDEFRPIIANIDRLVILDPSDAFSETTEIQNTPCEYVKPDPSGIMEFEDGRFDLITSLGVLHHIPNVSFVMSECYRCLEEGGIMLIREPISSMGDWRKQRAGLTRHERGIPPKILDQIINTTGFTVRHRSHCLFPLIPKLSRKLGFTAYNSSALTLADSMLSSAFKWNCHYHRTSALKKLAPGAIFYVLQK